VTNSERHIAELRELMQYAPDAFRSMFNSEHAEDTLRGHFADVQRFDCEVKATVRERETLVAYQQSVSVPSSPIPGDVGLPFVVHGRATIFVATT
jgi:hypothetical protein